MSWTLKIIDLKRFLYLIFSTQWSTNSYLKMPKPEKQEFKLYAEGWHLSNFAALWMPLLHYPEPYLDETKHIYYA